MSAGAVTDLTYLLLALADAPPLHALARWWSARRYARLAPDYDAYVARRPDYGDALASALAEADTRPRRILDVSTGTGFALSVLRRRFPSARVVGCDLSLAMLSRARANARGAALVCADSGRLPFADGVFDLVVVHNAPPRLGELSRVLSADGRLVVALSSAGGLPVWLRAAVARRLGQQGLRVSHRRVGAGWHLVAWRA